MLKRTRQSHRIKLKLGRKPPLTRAGLILGKAAAAAAASRDSVKSCCAKLYTARLEYILSSSAYTRLCAMSFRLNIRSRGGILARLCAYHATALYYYTHSRGN